MATAANQPQVSGPHGEAWPAMGLGTWRLGEAACEADREVGVIRHALEMGYRLIDTAEMYGEGGAERVVGRALAEALRQSNLSRDQVSVVSKVYPHHADAAGMLRACEASRRRLRLEVIDLYLLHWRGDIALAETLKGFEQLQRRGWIRHWGVSNFDLDDLLELDALAGGATCASNQVYYSLSERGVEHDLLPWMRDRRMPLMAYCPIDGGTLAKHKRLGALAESLGLTAAQLALAWILEQREVIAIPKAGSERHLLENWHCRGVQLSPETVRAVGALFPAPRVKRPLTMR